MKQFTLVLIFLLTGVATATFAQSTIIRYLSGRGAGDGVEWDFYCTEGRNSGKWTTISVPSCWELQGFGRYQYGIAFYGKAFPEGIAGEKGLYKHEFDVPAAWRGKQVNLVFEAAMTDTEVKINGQKAGPKHQGGFYRFSYDISGALKYGRKNTLEATVSKESGNAGVNLAERRADYWNFGGIFRPVFLEVKPAQNLRHVAVDARMDGSFTAHCFLNAAGGPGMNIRATLLDARGKKIAETTAPVRTGSDRATVHLNVNRPALWTAETPNLYKAQFTLLSGEGEALHTAVETFGFRTVEVRESDGLYVNGVRIMVRGVNRHSFRPESGRTLSREMNLEDVLLMKEMNMNAVRLSHYPPDPEFLQACDSLGLYVMNELGGWHGKYDTPTGVRLVRQMVERDVNHPSVIWWSNGNEKGWNTELDGEFHKYDPQRRPVIHPQGNYGGFETMHYRSYGESQQYMRLPEIYMPTEFLHGLYDGGHGAGLWDYWEMMRKHPRCAGGFLWALADEGVTRVDRNGQIDNQGNFGADGIVGPHHEREGSFYAIREIWNPVQVMNLAIDRNFNGVFTVENRYDFLNVNTCRFRWEQVKFPAPDAADGTKVLKQGEVRGSDIPAHRSGVLDIGTGMDADADALFLTAIDRTGHELWRWSFPVKRGREERDERAPAASSGGAIPSYTENEDELTVRAADNSYTFSKKNGRLKKVVAAGRTLSLTDGPRFIAARRADRSLDRFYNHDDEHARAKDRTYTVVEDAGVFTGFTAEETGGHLVLTANYKLGSLDRATWTIAPGGALGLDYTYNFSGVVELMGVRFDYPENKVLGKRWLGAGPCRVWQNRIHGTVYDVWENDYNDPVPGETFTYPEFKGYFAGVSWMDIRTQEGTIRITNGTPARPYIGVYQPRDGRDRLLYTLPESGISILDVIPAVRNKVNSTDLCGPSSQAVWSDGEHTGKITLEFR